MHPQYKLKESPIPSDEEESSEESSDDEFGPKKPKVDPDDPVARELFKELSTLFSHFDIAPESLGEKRKTLFNHFDISEAKAAADKAKACKFYPIAQ